MTLQGLVTSLTGLARELVSLARLQQVTTRLMRDHQGLRIGRGVEIRSPDRLRLGRRVTIESGVLLHCGGMSWDEGRGGISIGDDSYIGPQSVLFGAGGIQVGARVLISPGVVIASHEHSFGDRQLPTVSQPLRFGAIVIEDDVWIGSNATVLPGVTIGKGSVVGAGAVVTRSLPPHTLSAGVPARVRREL